ncbi:HpcH/HpaI aldolase/citrate lyase family protein [Agromyces aurantiacus]|uniref:HpcH/HpaI aldolase/citrate lyase family protein n=1 Tax=Agromyces aurantiacus TaxID=165814 RepID=A0ABV9R802_9MICO|nr:aldolase/citrate lyase family protein [Agromyces aurantiacus]MBM7505242.1 citrate lyase subunit beta/citryl-CoA lyase [Agromyces aurantiacus]
MTSASHGSTAGAVDADRSAPAAPAAVIDRVAAVAGVAPVAPELARSWLLVPGTADDLAARIADSTADVVVVDLEDGVAPDRKGEARRALVDAVDTLDALDGSGSAARVRVWVRIADAASDEWRTDVALLRGRGLVAGVVLAKVESPDHVRRTVDALGGGAAPPPIVALVESARGVEAALEIASAPGVTRLAFGSGDFRRDTGAADDPLALLYARSRLVSTSRAAGLPGPVDGPTVSRDAAALAEASAHAASVGMTGRLCLREEQVGAVHAAMSPSPGDLAWALEVLETLERCGIRDGSDLPRIGRARRISDAAAAFGLDVAAVPSAASDYSG